MCVSALDKEETKIVGGGGGGSENKAESVPPSPLPPFLNSDAKNGIQTNPKDKNQVSRDIKEAGQQTYLRKTFATIYSKLLVDVLFPFSLSDSAYERNLCGISEIFQVCKIDG